MKTCFRLFLVGMIAVFFAASFLTRSTAQKRRDNFSHGSAAHKKINCSKCHNAPTGNWVKARGYPDVADYPNHASCIQCHRSDFFSGNHPAICSNCHIASGPRSAARFQFPLGSHPREFSTVFPHDLHQNLIASNIKRNEVAVAHLMRASFTAETKDEKPQFNNCAICHQTSANLPKFAARTLTAIQPVADAASESFMPTAGFFKEAPNSHASCFTCHYQNVKPTRTACAACHALTSPYFESSVLKRYSLKFNHQDKDHINKDCTVCHVRITQNSDLRTMVNADVPILTCSTSSCHGKNLNSEISAREKTIVDKQPIFQCIYCHTTAIGRYQIPSSHKNN